MKKAINNIFILVFLGYLALLFNGEMYAHSWGALVMPTLVIFYILYVWLMKYLITKKSFSAFKIFITGSIIGLLLETFYSKSLFVNPFLFGVNWFSVAIQFLYWGMAALMPFYIYTQIKQKKFYKENKLFDSLIVAYLFAQFIINSFVLYPDTIYIWIFLGAPVAIYLLRKAKKKELVIKI